MIPATGDLVRVRSRQYLVEGVELPPSPGDSTLVRLSCIEDDAQGEPLEVLWECELDARLLRETDWERIASRGFDEPRLFSAFLHTLRWSCVTATDPRVWCRRSSAIADLGTVQALTSLAMAPKQRLFFLTTADLCEARS